MITQSIGLTTSISRTQNFGTNKTGKTVLRTVNSNKNLIKSDNANLLKGLSKKIGLLISVASLTIGGATGGMLITDKIMGKKIDAQTELIKQALVKSEIDSKKIQGLENELKAQNAKLAKSNELNKEKMVQLKEKYSYELTKQQATIEANSLIKDNSVLGEIKKETEQKKNILVEAGISAKDLKALENAINEQCKDIKDPFIKAAKTDTMWQKTLDYLMSQELVEEAYKQGQKEAYQNGMQEM